jgi:hypothetical protein
MHNALIPKAKAADIIAVDQFRNEARELILQAQRDGNEMALALTTARAIQGLRDLVKPEMMADMMSLMNTQLGFQTDKDPSRSREPVQPYPVEVVKDCFIVAQLWGCSPVNNEFNIISSRAYKTVNFFRRKVRELPGISDVTTQIAAPEYNADKTGARVGCICTWAQDGKRRVRKCVKDDAGDWRVSVKVNRGMGDDAIKGKAERKLLALVLADMLGTATEDDDDHIVETPAGFHDTIHTEPQQPYSVGDEIAADAAPQLAEQTPVDAPPVECELAIGEAGTEDDLKRLITEWDAMLTTDSQRQQARAWANQRVAVLRGMKRRKE